MAGVLRGVALVDAVFAERKKRGETFGGSGAADRAPTPALRRWLEQDDELFTLGEPVALRELLDAELPEFADAFEPLAALLGAPCVLFENWGADSRRFLYLGSPDEHGELPVFTLDIDDGPFACINGPVDVWLAQQVGFLEDEETYGQVPPEYEPARKKQAELNFDGYVSYLDGDLHRTLDPSEE